MLQKKETDRRFIRRPVSGTTLRPWFAMASCVKDCPRRDSHDASRTRVTPVLHSAWEMVPWLCQYVNEAPPRWRYTLATAGSAESGANLSDVCGRNWFNLRARYGPKQIVNSSSTDVCLEWPKVDLGDSDAHAQ
jgi:hypothetical protein